LHPYLNIAIAAARKAGDHIARMYDQMDRVKIQQKSAKNYVTSVDHESEAIIIEAIKDKYPRHIILSEEAGEIKEGASNTRWIIDPLDGTLNFMHGFPHFCVSIAVEINDLVEIGVIYNPLSQELYTATKGAGAQLNNKRIRINNDIGMKDALIGTGLPAHDNFTEILNACLDLRIAGAAALDLAFVACSRLDGFWKKRLQIWDFAAGVLLVEEAGGFVTDFSGDKKYNLSGNIIAGNKKVHQDLSRILVN
jgi:myo-inositol-1(or 4)-monophosphatase